MTNQDKQLLKNLPRDTERVILDNPQKKQVISKVVEKIYRDHQKDLRELSRS